MLYSFTFCMKSNSFVTVYLQLSQTLNHLLDGCDGLVLL